MRGLAFISFCNEFDKYNKTEELVLNSIKISYVTARWDVM